MIPITASTANMLLPVQAFRNGLWDRVGTEGTGEDGRILQAQASVGTPMRAVIDVDAATLTTLAPTYRETAAARRRWYQDALTYSIIVKLIQTGIALSLLGLGSALVALFFADVRLAGALTILGKYLNDFVHYQETKKYFPFFTRRSWLVWVPLQPWLLLSYALLPKPKKTSGRGFASS
ncbi:MAG: hypothetical protein OEM52_04535, partial [bacterium]|nr:hypothetical protein [bacterium]